MPGVFFVHIMKTGGVSVTNLLRRHFGDAAVYPLPDRELGPLRKVDTVRLLELSEEERRRFRAYSVHMPAWAAEAVAPDLARVTVLREPVERTLSHLRQITRIDWAPDRIEAVWDDEDWRVRLANYQTRLLAERPRPATEGELAAIVSALRRPTEGSPVRPRPTALGSFYATAVGDSTPLAPDALDRAEQVLGQFDVVGITEALGLVARRLGALLGATLLDVAHDNATRDPAPVSTSFRRRLEDDLRLDLELYERARSLRGVDR